MSQTEANARLATLLADRAAGKKISNEQISHATGDVDRYKNIEKEEAIKRINRANKESEKRIERQNEEDRKRAAFDQRRMIEAENRREELLEERMRQEDERAAEEAEIEAQRELAVQEKEALIKRNLWQILAIIKENDGSPEKIKENIINFLERKCNREGYEWLLLSDAYLAGISCLVENFPKLLLSINAAIISFEDFVFLRKEALAREESKRQIELKEFHEEEKIKQELERIKTLRKNEIEQEKIKKELSSYLKLTPAGIKCAECGYTGIMGYLGKLRPSGPMLIGYILLVIFFTFIGVVCIIVDFIFMGIVALIAALVYASKLKQGFRDKYKCPKCKKELWQIK